METGEQTAPLESPLTPKAPEVPELGEVMAFFNMIVEGVLNPCEIPDSAKFIDQIVKGVRDAIPGPTEKQLMAWCHSFLDTDGCLGILARKYDIDEAFSFAQACLTAKSHPNPHNLLVEFLIHVRRLPRGTRPESVTSPIPCSQLILKCNATNSFADSSKRWKKPANKKFKAQLDDAVRCPIEGGKASKEQIAGVFSRIAVDSCVEMLRLTDADSAFLYGINLLDDLGAFNIDPVLFLEASGIYPVPADTPENERAVREGVGRAVYEVILKLWRFRLALVLACKDVLPKDELQRLLHSGFYQHQPDANLFLVTFDVFCAKLKAVGKVQDPAGFLREKGVDLSQWV
ncbi:MAG: hypothetical protein WC897_02795 [Candidatus Gracilibacteria bacterium]